MIIITNRKNCPCHSLFHVISRVKKVKSLTTYISCGIISLSTSRCPSKELRTVHIEEDFIYIYCHPKTAEITNAARDSITRISFSVFLKMSQYTYDSFVTFAKTPQRVLDNEPSVAHVDKIGGDIITCANSWHHWGS